MSAKKSAFLIVVAAGLVFSKTSTVAANAASLAKVKKRTLSKQKTKRNLKFQLSYIWQ